MVLSQETARLIVWICLGGMGVGAILIIVSLVSAIAEWFIIKKGLPKKVARND